MLRFSSFQEFHFIRRVLVILLSSSFFMDSFFFVWFEQTVFVNVKVGMRSESMTLRLIVFKFLVEKFVGLPFCGSFD